MLHGPLFRIWPRRKYVRRSSRHRWLLSSFFILAAVMAGGIWLLEKEIRPVAVELACVRVRSKVSGLVSAAVEETLAREKIDAHDIVEVSVDEEGRITALTSSPVKLNSIRAKAMKSIGSKVNMLDNIDFDIPLGSLTGILYITDMGPSLPVRILSAATAGCDFRNEFVSEGINQTLYRIMLDIAVEVKLLVPGGPVSETVETELCLVEMVVMGDIPQSHIRMPGY